MSKIQIQKKLVQVYRLLDELETSQKAEEYEYVLKHDYTECGVVFCSIWKDGNLVKADKHERCLSWFKIRNINFLNF